LQTLDVDYRISQISFSRDGTRLHTDYGTLNISSSLTNATDIETLAFQAVSLKGEWIFRGSQRSLWLYPDYRPSVVAVFGNCIVLGQVSGRMLIMQFIS
jgi:hypothetical protein